MGDLNRLTPLVNELLDIHRYNIPNEKLVDVNKRIEKNLKRYELVYFLMTVMVHLNFLIFYEELLIPTMFALFIPFLLLFFHSHLQQFHFKINQKAHVVMCMIGFFIAWLKDSHLVFVSATSLSFILIAIHSYIYDCSECNNI